MTWRYIIKRFLILIPTFFGITIFAYLISALAPGSPLDFIFGGEAISQADLQKYQALYGLGQPLPMQYLHWLKNFLTGDLGTSYRTAEPVLSMIMDRLGPTLLITLTSMVLAIAIAIPLGCLAAEKPYTAWDYISCGLSFFATSAPNFFVGLLVIYLFAVKLKWLPTGGMYTTLSDKSALDTVLHMILPTLVLTLHQIGSLLRQVRSSMLETLQEDYIRTAREKGLTERRVVIRHALRNALIPIITQIGMSIPFLIGGAVITEKIFSWPGIGTLMSESINYRDYPCIMGITTFVATVVLCGNFLLDILYCVLDPRIRHQEGGRNRK